MIQIIEAFGNFPKHLLRKYRKKTSSRLQIYFSVTGGLKVHNWECPRFMGLKEMMLRDDVTEFDQKDVDLLMKMMKYNSAVRLNPSDLIEEISKSLAHKT